MHTTNRAKPAIYFESILQNLTSGEEKSYHLFCKPVNIQTAKYVHAWILKESYIKISCNEKIMRFVDIKICQGNNAIIALGSQWINFAQAYYQNDIEKK